MDDISIEKLIQSTIRVALLKAHPVGSVDIRVDEQNPGDLYGGTWEKISQGRVLQGKQDSQEVESLIAAGLPALKGSFEAADHLVRVTQPEGSPPSFIKGTGAFYISNSGGNVCRVSSTVDYYSATARVVNFDSSRYNSIFGASDTVQPPAFLVNIWKRTA